MGADVHVYKGEQLARYGFGDPHPFGTDRHDAFHNEFAKSTAAGEVDVALVNHYYLFRLKKEHGADYPVENHFFRNGKSGSLINVAGIGVMSTSDDQESAQKFIAFLHSDESQKYFASETYEYPVAGSAAAYEGLPPLSELKPPTVDFGKVGNLEQTVKLLRKNSALP